MATNDQSPVRRARAWICRGLVALVGVLALWAAQALAAAPAYANPDVYAADLDATGATSAPYASPSDNDAYASPYDNDGYAGPSDDAGYAGPTDDAGPSADAAPHPSTAEPHLDAPHGDAGPSLSTSDAIKAILGLIVLFALAYLGGHPAVRRFERRLGVAQLVTAGFPFVLLGLLGRSEGVLSPAVLQAIGPLLPLGLGWIGFAIGFRFDIRIFDAFPRALAEAFLTLTLVPFVAMIGAAAAMLALTEGISADAAFIRDALVLATAGVVTARSLTGLLSVRGAEATNIARIQRLIQLEELAAFAGLILLAAFFRPEALGPQAGWVLPAVGWVFVTIGVGAALGVIIFAALRTINGETETSAVMLGSIILAAGAASTLRLSPLVVCFLAGALLSNFHGAWKEQVGKALARLERPIYLLFLVLAGALWRPDAWEAWVLLLLFVVARLVSRHVAVRIFARRHPDAMSPIEQRHLAASPMGALAIAIVISAEELFAGPTVPWIVHAIIGGSLATEIVVRLFARQARTKPPTVHETPIPLAAAPAPDAAEPASTPASAPEEDPWSP